MNAIVHEDMTAIASAALPWQEFSGATVLITGAYGFLAAYMVETLLFLNDSVLARPARLLLLVRDRARAVQRFRHAVEGRDFEILVQDVSQPLAYSGRLDFVIHAASHATPAYYQTDPVGTLSPNVLGTYHLLEAARRAGTKGFLFFSSGEVYGVMADATRPVTEVDGGFLDPLHARACYGESKRMGETMCAAWAGQWKVPTRIVRPFHTYGPGMQLDDGRVFADFVRDILGGGPIVLASDGQARRTFCYLADATVGFFTVLLRGEDGTAYNVANRQGECSIAELADRLAGAYREDGICVEQRLRKDASYLTSAIVSTVPDVAKLEALGWRSRWGIEEGFRRTVESYRLASPKSTSPAMDGADGSGFAKTVATGLAMRP